MASTLRSLVRGSHPRKPGLGALPILHGREAPQVKCPLGYDSRRPTTRRRHVHDHARYHDPKHVQDHTRQTRPIMIHDPYSVVYTCPIYAIRQAQPGFMCIHCIVPLVPVAARHSSSTSRVFPPLSQSARLTPEIDFCASFHIRTDPRLVDAKRQVNAHTPGGAAAASVSGHNGAASLASQRSSYPADKSIMHLAPHRHITLSNLLTPEHIDTSIKPFRRRSRRF